jgi:hypothetical protein
MKQATDCYFTLAVTCAFHFLPFLEANRPIVLSTLIPTDHGTVDALQAQQVFVVSMSGVTAHHNQWQWNITLSMPSSSRCLYSISVKWCGMDPQSTLPAVCKIILRFVSLLRREKQRGGSSDLETH